MACDFQYSFVYFKNNHGFMKNDQAIKSYLEFVNLKSILLPRKGYKKKNAEKPDSRKMYNVFKNQFSTSRSVNVTISLCIPFSKCTVKKVKYVSDV